MMIDNCHDDECALDGTKLKFSLTSVGSMKVRGHCLLWAVESTVQSWVKALSVDDLRKAIWHHVNDTLAMTRGL